MMYGDVLSVIDVESPSKKEFERLVDKGTRVAEENKIKEEDIEEIIHKHMGINV